VLIEVPERSRFVLSSTATTSRADQLGNPPLPQARGVRGVLAHRRAREPRGPSQGGIRSGLKAPTCLAFLVVVFAVVLPVGAQAALPQPIYFFTDTAQPINKENPLVIRPKGFLLFQDGQWNLEGLRWTGWGSSVARATGVSSSSNDIPNAAEGKRIKTWVHVTLSNPGRFQGHEVYRCFTMTVPPPASDMHLCLGHAHGIYILEQAKQPTPPPSNSAGFQVRLTVGFFLCPGVVLG
jgi:hypothetical protein